LNKDRVIDILKTLPQEFELDVLIEKLIFVEKVDRGLVQCEQCKVISHDTIKTSIKKI
jgi:hypothetical protein